MVKSWDIRLAIFQEDHPLVSPPDVVKPVYREHCSAMLAAGIDMKFREKFTQLDCLIMRDNHWMSMFIKNSSIVVRQFLEFNKIKDAVGPNF